jgi:hypothetical protein
VIDKVRSSQSPANALPARMQAAMAVARSATAIRADGGMPWVMPRKVGTSPIGSTTATSVTKAETRNS